MGDPRGNLPPQRETRVDTHTREIRLDDESPRVRSYVEFDSTPVAYKVEGGIGLDGAWGAIEGSAEAGSVVEKASAALLTLGATVIPPLTAGGLAHSVGALPAISLVIAGIVWIIALVAALHITSTR